MKGEPARWPDDGVILYDGVCVLCSGGARFVAKRDRARRFRFTAIQSSYGAAMAHALHIDPNDPDTNAVVLGRRIYRRSDATLVVLSLLPWWRWTAALWLVPRPIRDAIYTFVARNRYRLFGRRESCDLGGTLLAGRVLADWRPDAP
jgi:predicted DCC family thiol-disulfide oxidoreductase YuxK